MSGLSETQFEIKDLSGDGDFVQITDGVDFTKKLNVLAAGDSALLAKGLVLLGLDPSNNAKGLSVDAGGNLKVTGGGGGFEVLDGQLAVPATDLGGIIAGFDGANYRFLKTNVTGELQSNVGANDMSSWMPAPYNWLLDTTGPLFRDVANQLITRSTVLTDEASFRDDFTGSSLAANLTGTVTFTNGSTTVTGSGTAFTTELYNNRYIKLSAHADTAYTLVANVISDTELELDSPYPGANGSGTAVWSRWIPVVVTGGSIAVTASEVQLTVDTASGALAAIDRLGDYGPYSISFAVRISQRIANQEFHIGFTDVEDCSLISAQAVVFFSGTDNTKVGLRTSWDTSDVEESTFSLPGGLTTATKGDYQLELNGARVTLSVNGIFVGEHKLHIPGPYTTMGLHACMRNTAAAASGTIAYVDALFFTNYDQVQIAATPKNDPLSVRAVEDQHNITGTITTTSTTVDQVIVSYTVPAGKSFWILGYTINNGETTIRGNPVKIGRNTITTEPAGPGTVDGNIFRMYNMPASTLRDEDYGGMPRRLGNAGDVIKVTVTPTGGTSTVWRASLDFILR